MDYFEKREAEHKAKYPNPMWVVCVHNDIDEGAWEISVAYTTNEHAFNSWGWDGEQKIIMFDEHHEGDDSDDEDYPTPSREQKKEWTKKIEKQKMIAQLVADALNTKGWTKI